jgi:hypothetical protein
MESFYSKATEVAIPTKKQLAVFFADVSNFIVCACHSVHFQNDDLDFVNNRIRFCHESSYSIAFKITSKLSRSVNAFPF